MDWILAAVISNIRIRICIEALEEALQRFEAPEIFNTDQGSQFTCEAFTDVLSVDHGWQGPFVAYETPTELISVSSQRTGPTHPRCGRRLTANGSLRGRFPSVQFTGGQAIWKTVRKLADGNHETRPYIRDLNFQVTPVLFAVDVG